MRLLLENGHVPAAKRYTNAIVEDATADLLYFYDSCGAFVKWRKLDLPYEGGNNGPDLDEQTLTLNGKVISISNGNSIDLTPIIPIIQEGGEVIAPDNQALHLVGNILSIDRGGSVDLTSVVGSGSGGTAAAPVIRETAANTTVVDNDDYIIATSGGITINMGSATTARVRPVTILNEGTTNIFFTAASGQTVGGVTSSIIVPDQSVTFIPKANKWRGPV